MPTEFSEEQDHLFRCLAEAWPRYVHLEIEQTFLKGGMGFKKVNGAEYLVRYWQDEVTGKKRFSSLGRRSPETERKLAAFLDERERTRTEYSDLEAEIEIHCRLARAHRLARVPARVGFGFRAFDFAMHEKRTLLAAGAASVHAFEIHASRAMEEAIVAHGEQAPLRFVYEDHLDEDEVEALLLCFAIDPIDTPRSQAQGVTRVHAPDGLVVEFFDRRDFAAIDGADVVHVAVARDAQAVPMSCVSPAVWLEIEARYPANDRAFEARIEFVEHIYGRRRESDLAFRV